MFQKTRMPSPAEALKGRAEKMSVPAKHHVLDATIEGPYPPGTQKAIFGLGCFWGAEKKFWQLPGVYTTAVGYAAGMSLPLQLKAQVLGIAAAALWSAAMPRA